MHRMRRELCDFLPGVSECTSFVHDCPDFEATMSVTPTPRL